MAQRQLQGVAGLVLRFDGANKVWRLTSGRRGEQGLGKFQGRGPHALQRGLIGVGHQQGIAWLGIAFTVSGMAHTSPVIDERSAR